MQLDHKRKHLVRQGYLVSYLLNLRVEAGLLRHQEVLYALPRRKFSLNSFVCRPHIVFKRVLPLEDPNENTEDLTYDQSRLTWFLDP